MKVRWMQSSLRLRITPTELDALQSGEAMVERAAFPGGWSITLQQGDESTLLSNAPGIVTLTLDAPSLAELSQPEAEGVYLTREDIKFFVEKDFPCVHPRPSAAEESSETFAPPAGFEERKA